MLTELDVKGMINEIKSSNDGFRIEHLKETLLNEYEPVLVEIIKNLDDKDFDFDDLYQEAAIAFLDAIEAFDTTTKRKFSDFIRTNVKKRIEYSIEESKKNDSIPEYVMKSLNEIIDAEEKLTQSFRRYPSNIEVMDYLDYEEEEFKNLKKYAIRVIGVEDTDENYNKNISVLIKEKEASPAQSNENKMIEALKDTLDILSIKEQKIIKAYYGLDEDRKSIEEIASIMNLSTERIRQAINLINTKIKREIEDFDLGD